MLTSCYTCSCYGRGPYLVIYCQYCEVNRSGTIITIAQSFRLCLNAAKSIADHATFLLHSSRNDFHPLSHKTHAGPNSSWGGSLTELRSNAFRQTALERPEPVVGPKSKTPGLTGLTNYVAQTGTFTCSARQQRKQKKRQRQSRIRE